MLFRSAHRGLVRRAWVRLALLALGLIAPVAVRAQPSPNSPLPDALTLISQVRQHQRQMDSVQENYTFREQDVTQELNKNGSVKKTESETYEIFYVNSHEVRRLVQKDGKDLSADDQKKQQQHVLKEIEKAQQTPAGEDPRGVIRVSHILLMGKFSSPRREIVDGRSTIAFDFQGDPHAKAHDIAEDAARRTSGTVWIDEKDREVRRMVARLNENVHAGFGLLSLGKGSNLTFDQRLVNNELWLPTGADIYVVAHAIGVFGVRANIHMTVSDYKRFHAEARQQAGATVSPSAH